MDGVDFYVQLTWRFLFIRDVAAGGKDEMRMTHVQVEIAGSETSRPHIMSWDNQYSVIDAWWMMARTTHQARPIQPFANRCLICLKKTQYLPSFTCGTRQGFGKYQF